MQTHCPNCKADMRGAEIPEEDRKYYGNKTHFSRRIAMYDRDLDMTVGYRCPDCGHYEERKFR